jgi:hypothetical protein
MTAQVIITGWADNLKVFDWGTALTVSVDQRRTNDAGEWETIEKTQYDVALGEAFDLGDAKKVIVTGKIKGTNTYTKRDGTQGFSIKVSATSIERFERPSFTPTEDLPF